MPSPDNTHFYDGLLGGTTPQGQGNNADATEDTQGSTSDLGSVPSHDDAPTTPGQGHAPWENDVR